MRHAPYTFWVGLFFAITGYTALILSYVRYRNRSRRIPEAPSIPDATIRLRLGSGEEPK